VVTAGVEVEATGRIWTMAATMSGDHEHSHSYDDPVPGGEGARPRGVTRPGTEARAGRLRLVVVGSHVVDGGDVITAVGVGLSFLTSAAALAVAMRSERRRQREREEDRAVARTEAAKRALAGLEAFAINYGAPAKEELNSGDLGGYLAGFRSAREVVLSDLLLLKAGTVDTEVADMADDAIGTIAKLSMDVEGAIQTRHTVLEMARQGRPLPAGQPSPEADFWFAARQNAQHLNQVRSDIHAAVRGS